MLASLRWSCSFTLIVTVSGLAIPQEQPAKPRVDALGDPLPEGAIARLGTTRFQLPSQLQPGQLPVSIAGGKAYLWYDWYMESPGKNRSQILWIDSDNGRTLQAWPVPDNRAFVGFSPDGQWGLFKTRGSKKAGAFEKLDRSFGLYLFDLHRKEETRSFKGEFKETEGNSPRFMRCVFSADGKLVAATILSDLGWGVRVWETTTGKQVWASLDHKDFGVDFVGFTPSNDELILRRRKDGHIFVGDVARGEFVRDFPTVFPSFPGILSPDGTALLSTRLGSMDFQVWDVKSGKERPAFSGHKGPAGLTAIAFSKDRKFCITAAGDEEVHVRDWPSGKVRRKFNLSRAGVQYLFLSADSATLNVVFPDERTLHRYAFESGKPRPSPIDTHFASVYQVAATPDGSIVSFGADNVLRTWDLATSKQTRQLRVNPPPQTSWGAISHDGNRVAFEQQTTVITIIDRQNGKVVQTIAAPDEDTFRLLRFSPDGRFLVSSDARGQVVNVWDTLTGKSKASIGVRSPSREGFEFGCAAIAFSPDGKTLLVAEENHVQVWDANRWKQTGIIQSQASELAFSPDGRVVACTGEKDVTVWELASHKLRATFTGQTKFTYVHGMHFSSNGRFLACPSGRQIVEVWDVVLGKSVAAFKGHKHGIATLTFTRDDRHLVTASGDCTLLVWDLPASARLAMDQLDEKALHATWGELASAEANVAFAAIRTLVSIPDQSIKLIRATLQPAAPLDVAPIRKLLTELDNPVFATRQRAMKDLEAFGDRAESPIREFLSGDITEEARKRADQVLLAVTGLVSDPERLRQIRAVEVLERIGSEAAKTELNRLAGGAPDSRLTRDAAESLRRLAKK